MKASPATVERGWLSLNDAAYYVGVGREKLKAAAYRGELSARIRPADGEGGLYAPERLCFHREDLDRWVRTHWKSPAVATRRKERTPSPGQPGVPNLEEVN